MRLADYCPPLVIQLLNLKLAIMLTYVHLHSAQYLALTGPVVSCPGRSANTGRLIEI